MRWEEDSVRRETVASRMCNRIDHSAFYDTRYSSLFHAKRSFISSLFLSFFVRPLDKSIDFIFDEIVILDRLAYKIN